MLLLRHPVSTALSPHPASSASIEARLERIERALKPVETFAQQAPLLLATVTEIGDAVAARVGNVDARSAAVLEVVERLSRPETAHTLERLLEMAEQAPSLMATTVDILDEVMRRCAESGLPIEHLLETAQQFIRGLAELSTSPEVRNLLQSGMLNNEAVQTLGRAAEAMASASRQPAPKVGMWGALSSFRKPEVQRALGFLIQVAERFGQNLDNADR
ncbi:MAG: DUF1641 domain-containing protein [Myxococcota bacterium]